MSRLNDAIGALPQHPPMRLLDRALHIDEHSAVAEVDVRADALFLCAPDGVPSWVALEYLGQTAALIGQAVDVAGDVTSDGFLLGSRRMTLDPQPFRVGETLTVSCRAQGALDHTLATFEGEVHDARGRLRASAILSVVRLPRTETVSDAS